ncbi:hypothetical protein [Candidatus Trichorickettsia mobilis]|uniref:hypothetical protein n=1 Tax=Candidatus Trichorickettsia mobilis TaxID=1346319 RepID=UPI002930CFFC|nr:hypothetical protein [Candidatus Trichorickettsia mobilis]
MPDPEDEEHKVGEKYNECEKSESKVWQELERYKTIDGKSSSRTCFGILSELHKIPKQVRDDPLVRDGIRVFEI